jgi:hypothetical protein
MGAALSNVIKSIDGSDDAEKQIQESLNALFALGESRNDAAWAKATSDAMKVYAPIAKVLLRRQSIVASASVGTDQIVGGIKKAVGNLMSGQILDGYASILIRFLLVLTVPRVTDIIGNALDVVLGSSAGSISSSYTYALVATDLGALLRIDVDIYSFELKSKGLQNHAKNMTAITSIISTINPQTLTVGDLRGIVSLSYGGSPEERQKAIFEIVKAAWDNDRKISLGNVLTEEDHTNYRSLMRPSEYEARAATRTFGALSIEDKPQQAPKVDRATLMAAHNTWVTKRASTAAALKEGKGVQAFGAVENGATVNGNTAIARSGGRPVPAPMDESDMADVFIFVIVTTQVDMDWIALMGGALSGFNVAGMFKYVEVSGGLSGHGITFRCKVNSSKDNFSICIKYIEQTVLPKIQHATYLSEIVSQMALQYSHPSADGSGLDTKVVYRENRIKNDSGDTLYFYDGTKLVLTLAAKEEHTLDGTVSHIASQAAGKPAGAAGENGDGNAGTPPPPPPAPRGDEPETQWVTYAGPFAIVRKVEMTVVKAGADRDSGYLILTNDGSNQDLTIAYTVMWGR